MDEAIAAVAVHAFSADVKRGVRRSKKDVHITVDRGDVVLLHSPGIGQPPFVLKINGGVQTLSYHPGNFIMSAHHYRRYAGQKHKDNQIIYQDRWFVIYTNLRVLQASLVGMLKAGGDPTVHIPLMERIVTNWTYKNQSAITDEMEKSWNKYFKLRELWMRPGYKGEGEAAKRMGVKVISALILKHIAPTTTTTEVEEEWS